MRNTTFLFFFVFVFCSFCAPNEVQQETNCLTSLNTAKLLDNMNSNGGAQVVRNNAQRVVKLHLKAGTNSNLDSLDCLSVFTRVKDLSLANINLSLLPSSLSALVVVEKLDISSNRLTALDYSITNMSELSDLDFSSNFISIVPFSLDNFVKLTSLNVSNNILQRFPVYNNPEDPEDNNFKYDKNCFIDSIKSFTLSSNCDKCIVASDSTCFPSLFQCGGSGCSKYKAASCQPIDRTEVSDAGSHMKVITSECDSCGGACLCESFSQNLCPSSCSWCISTNQCVTKGFCPCDGISDVNECNSSLLCRFCDSAKTCQNIATYNSKCVICDKMETNDRCKESDGCKWCNSELTCKNLENFSCNNCEGENNNTAKACSQVGIGCSFCPLNKKCQNGNCPTCSISGGSCPSGCLSCGSNCVMSMFRDSSECVCPQLSNEECIKNSLCVWNSAWDICIDPSVDEGTADWFSCEDITDLAVCSARPGCHACKKSLTCRGIKESCDSCSELTDEMDCESLSWCRWCEVGEICTDGSCPTCDKLKKKESCKGSCNWCQSKYLCIVSSASSSCPECASLSGDGCTSQPGCDICADGTCADFDVCTAEAKSNNTGTVLTVVLVIIIVLLVVVVVGSVYICFTRGKLFISANKELHSAVELQQTQRNQDQDTMFELATGIGGDEVLLSKSKLSLEAMKSSLIGWDNEIFPLETSDTEIRFNKSDADLLEINRPYEHSIRIKNKSPKEVSVNVYAPATSEEETINVEPPQFTVKSGAEQTLIVSITLRCTKKLRKASLFVDVEGVGHTEIKLYAESMISTILSYHDLKKESTIGEGGYGIVYLGKYRGQKVAIKEMKAWGINDTKAIDEIRREVDLMKKLRSPYIVTFFGTVSTKKRMCIVMEYCAYGTLTHLLKKTVEKDLKLKIALDCAEGIKFLHANNIMHRDLKPDNLLVVSTSVKASCCVKLTDFGSSRAAIDNGSNQNLTRGVGTPAYMAPEILSGDDYSYPSDIYSYAMTLYELWMQHPPFEGMEAGQYIDYYIEKGNRLELPEDCVYAKVIEMCWKQDPDDRMKINDVVDEVRALQ